VELVTKHGYPVETHHVTTEDGYVLEMHRIPPLAGVNATNGAERPTGPKKPPVLLLHGFGCSSVHWVLMGSGKGLGNRI
jgi:pimeloyl-ACP methyl ester carboxylesterase